MEVTTGLFEGMVLQRNKQNVCDVAVTGQCQTAGAVEVRVTAKGKAVKGLAGAKIGQAARGRFTARLKGLPVGGPYTVELRIGQGAEKGVPKRPDVRRDLGSPLTVRDVYVGDVWILGGQSNMQGCGLLADRAKPNPKVRAFYMTDRWAPAEDPIHNLWVAVDPVHGATGEPAKPPIVGVGPGVAFGQDMLAATGVPQGLIACGHGGTSMSQWDPKLKKLGGGSLYGASVRRFHKNGSKVAGVVWYQGCSEANADAAGLYTPRMKELVSAMRRDFGDPKGVPAAMNRGGGPLPIVIVQISRVLPLGWPDYKSWNSVQDQQRRLGETVDRLATVPAIDLEVDDSIHVSGRSCHVLGQRLARAMRVLIHGRKAGKGSPPRYIAAGCPKPPIALKSVRTMADPTQRLYDRVIVEFDHVEGKLVAPCRPEGFALADSSGVTPVIFRIELDGPRAILHTTSQRADLEALCLHYGYGVNPYCNITDRAGRSLPVFGPVPVGRLRAITPFVQEFLVSDFLPAPAKLVGLEYQPVASLNLQPRKFPERLCARNLEIIKTKGQVGVYYYACRFRCDEDMKLQAVLGYDGALKVWVDGREIFFDPEGTNPAGASDATAPLIPTYVGTGEHEVLIALGNNNGNAWGICLRLERLDVPRAALKKGPMHYKLPTILPMG